MQDRGRAPDGRWRYIVSLHIARLLPLTLFVLLGADSCPGTTPDQLPNGSWGGQHIGMTVTDTGAVIQYDCATGTITQPLSLDPGGSFTWRGVHYPGHGGPVRIGEVPVGHPATYTGHATTDKLTLTLAVPELGFTPQTFELTKGGAAQVFRCL